MAFFSERSRNITDTCDRTWSRSWNLGVQSTLWKLPIIIVSVG